MFEKWVCILSSRECPFEFRYYEIWEVVRNEEKFRVCLLCLLNAILKKLEEVKK